MAKITLFSALRPSLELVSEICELPYDVFSVREAREVAERRPRSILGNSKPEIGRTEGETAPSREEIYAGGRRQFDRLYGRRLCSPIGKRASISIARSWALKSRLGWSSCRAAGDTKAGQFESTNSRGLKKRTTG